MSYINNIEGIKFSSVVNKKKINYSEFRKHLAPKYGIVWRDLSLGYILFAATILCFVLIESVIKDFLILLGISIPFGFLAAFWLANIQLFIHEAAHYNIHPNKKCNDLLANILIGSIVGVNIKAYRKTHWKHHNRLGFTDDTEHSYFEAISITYILKMLTGLHVLTILKNRNKLENAQTEASLKKQKTALIIGAVLNLVVIMVFLFLGLYFTALVWVITVGVFYPFFAALRQIIEHRDELADPKTDFSKTNHGKVSRLFEDGLFSYFFGGAGFNRHMLHHWDPQISYTRLKEVEAFLVETEICGQQIIKSKTSYFKTFLKLLQ